MWDLSGDMHKHCYKIDGKLLKQKNPCALILSNKFKPCHYNFIYKKCNVLSEEIIGTILL